MVRAVAAVRQCLFEEASVGERMSEQL